MAEFKYDIGDKLKHKSENGPRGTVAECFKKNDKYGYCILDKNNKPHFVDEEDLERDIKL